MVTGYGYDVDGGTQEANFDVKAFSVERPEKLHPIPNGGKSRVWTCDVRLWSTWQTRAIRRPLAGGRGPWREACNNIDQDSEPGRAVVGRK